MKALLSSIVLVALLFTGCSKPAKPALPVSVTFREAALQKSKVAQIHSNSNESLKIVVVCVGKDGAAKKSSELLLEPKGLLQIGHMEGWPFLTGEKVVVKSAGFADLSVDVP